MPDQIVNSAFTRNLAGSANRIKYTEIGELYAQVEQTIRQSLTRKYIYGYWPGFDTSSHLLGSESEDSLQKLIDFDNHLRIFAESIEGTDTKVIITGDHGFDDVIPSSVIYTRDHPLLEQCLTLPLCGDTRSVYAYVRPQKLTQFERYIDNEFGDFCELHLSTDLIDAGWFGTHDPHPHLSDRVGDYTMIFKEGHSIVNCFPGFDPPVLTGHHGGITPDEMLVPLCVIDC